MDEKTLKQMIKARFKQDDAKCKILYKVLKQIYNEVSEYHGRFSRLFVIDIISKKGIANQKDSETFFNLMVETNFLSTSGTEFHIEDQMYEYIEAVLQPKSPLEKHVDVILPIARFLAKRLILGAYTNKMQYVIKDMQRMIPDACEAFEKKTKATLEQLVAQMYDDHFIVRIGTKSHWRTLLGKRLTG